MTGEERGAVRPDRRVGLLIGASWLVVLAATAYLAYRSYDRETAKFGYASDFQVFFSAGREIAAGHGLYQAPSGSLAHAYVYPPLVALVLSAFAHSSELTVLRAWSVLSIVAVPVVAACMVEVTWSQLRSWQRPLLFIVCCGTAYEFYPYKFILLIGESDAFVLVVFALAAVAIGRRWFVAAGFLCGVAGLVKVWPGAGIVDAVARRRERAVWQEVVGFLVAVLIAPVMAAAISGLSGISQMVRAVFDNRSQSWLVSDSVWGIPRLLFSRSGLAKPLAVSAPARYLLTIVLLAWVLALIVRALRSRQEAAPSLGLWHVLTGIVLLLPVSHQTYSVLALPLLWLWLSRVASGSRRDPVTLVTTALLVVWWLVLTRSWPSDSSPASISAVRYSVIFIANLAALTVSVLGEWTVLRRVPRSDAADVKRGRSASRLPRRRVGGG